MSRVIFMCGPAGSGKSTYARQLERQGMTRLSIDAAAWQHGVSSMPMPADLSKAIETDLKAELLALVAAGRDVVLDCAFWSRQMRDEYRALLAPSRVVPETIYLAADRETVLQRVRARRGGHPDDFILSEDMAAAYYDNFEVPSADEGPLLIVDA